MSDAPYTPPPLDPTAADRWRPVTTWEPADVGDEWRRWSERNQLALDRAPVVARGRDLIWTETANEHRYAMLIGRQAGFPTMGTSLSKVGIPAGHHTGRQRHGEEAIHVLEGNGFIVVDGRRYDFHAGTTIHVPFMSEHQLFNTGDSDVTYVTAGSHELDLFVMLGRFEQLEDKGENPRDLDGRFPAEDGQFDTLGRRIALHLEDAPDEEALRQARRAAARAAAEAQAGEAGSGHNHGHGHGDGHGHGHAHGSGQPEATTPATTGSQPTYVRKRREENINADPHRHGAIYVLMGGGESKSDIRNGFTAVSVSMTNIFEEVPHTSSHCHTHTEAVLYVLEGVGFSEIDFEHYDWEAGDAVHVPPRMTRHEHFNPSDGRTRTLRIEYGVRYFYEPLWRGFERIEHRSGAVARP